MARLVMDVEHSDLNAVVLEEIMDLVRFFGNCQDDTPCFTVESVRGGDVRGIVLFKVEWERAADDEKYITSDGSTFDYFNSVRDLHHAQERQSQINSHYGL